MKSKVLDLFVVGAVVCFIASPLFAHHGEARYDMKKAITLSGTITAFDWGNPHCLVHMDVMDASGKAQHWTLEMAATLTMSKRGWDKDTLKRGDRVTAETYPAKNGVTLGISSGPGFLLKFVINGKEILTR
jgi:hypothetical protein